MAESRIEQEWVGWSNRRSRLGHLDQAAQKLIGPWLHKIGERFRASAYTMSPRGKRPSGQVTPPLRDSWVWEVHGTEGVLSNSARHYPFVDKGTKRHTIRPKRGTVLAWPGEGGGMVFARSVNHPGTRPQKIGQTIFKAMKPEMEKGAGNLGEDLRAELVRLWEG